MDVIDREQVRLDRTRLSTFRSGAWATAVLAGLALVAIGTVAAAGSDTVPADIIYRGGIIHTVDAHGTLAQALAITAGRISYVGSDAGVESQIGPGTRIVELHGRMVMPGLIDGHMHPVAGGLDLLKCSLQYQALTVRQFQSRIQHCLDAQPGIAADAWLEVVGWFRYGITPRGTAVTRATLDALHTHRPVVVHDSFGHSSIANTRALALARITSETRDPVGGRLGRDASGAPDGVLEDAAQELIMATLPKPTPADSRAAARAALDALRRQGVTSFLDAIGDPPDIEAFAALERTGELTARAHFAPLIRPAEVPDIEAARRAVARVAAIAKRYDEGEIRPQPSLSVRHVKLFMDGVINAPANTGALLAPYLENHGTAAAPRFEPAARREPDVYFGAPALAELLIGIGHNHLDPHLHTDGDGAVRAGLDAVQALRAVLPGEDIRPGFAHCELVDPADYPRFNELGVIPVLSFQWEKPAPDTIEGTRNTLGAAREAIIEPAGVLLAKGARIAFGSDWPVDPLDEWFALQVGVTREARQGHPPEYAGRLGTDPGLPRDFVIKAITLNAAYELHDDRSIGSLEVGKLADLVVLDRDVATVPPQTISATKVLQTVVGGRVVYDSELHEP
jgi:predicted amidohydrolase YtcJ